MERTRRGLPNDCKIIAIRPGEQCRPEFLKVLKAGRIYTLYNDYVINEETDEIQHASTVPESLFNADWPSINVSAIAGQNGAGKSTLIELLFMAVNNIAVVNELNDDLVPVFGLEVEIYCLVGRYYKISVHNQNISVYRYLPAKGKHQVLSLNREQESFTNYDLNGFFFSIAINYSLYAHNSLEIPNDQADWLNGLFHKNDSYQTPLVINPWRDKGNININNENVLVRLRLMANLLRTQKSGGFTFRKPSDNLTAVKLILRANPSKSKRRLFSITREGRQADVTLDTLTQINRHEILRRLNKIYPFKYKKTNDHRSIEASEYLIGKLITIALTYDEYKNEHYFDADTGEFDMNKIDKFLEQIINDPSHIAFKVKQTLNFLKYPYLDFKDADIDIEHLSQEIANIRKRSKIKYKIEELLPPPIFNVDILLVKDAEVNSMEPISIPFSTLSSGERQQIYSISSVIYHLINLDSIRRRKKKVQYQFVHIVLEEVELYFHPEMQRCYVKKLLDAIKNVQLENIKGINICFVTHSPFILSDIPDANVMFLQVQNQVSQLAAREEKTFGANIHDLLADGFFMYNGFCGEFATQKINETITFLDYHRRLKLLHSNRMNLQANITNSLHNSISEVELNKEEAALAVLFKTMHGISEDSEDHYKLIKSIGEPVLSIKLLEMYDELYSSNRRETLEAQMRKLQEELDKMNEN